MKATRHAANEAAIKQANQPTEQLVNPPTNQQTNQPIGKQADQTTNQQANRPTIQPRRPTIEPTEQSKLKAHRAYNMGNRLIEEQIDQECHPTNQGANSSNKAARHGANKTYG